MSEEIKSKKMNSEEIKKLEQEKASLMEKMNQLEQAKNQMLTRVVEIQGIIRYLSEKNKKEKEK